MKEIKGYTLQDIQSIGRTGRRIYSEKVYDAIKSYNVDLTRVIQKAKQLETIRKFKEFYDGQG